MVNKNDNTEGTFFALLRAGLWVDVGFTESWSHGSVDWAEVYQLVEEQSVIGVALCLIL